jgi:hypothetical protein
MRDINMVAHYIILGFPQTCFILLNVDLANMVMFRCPDPRTLTTKPGPIHLPPGVVPLQQDSTQPMRSGHYMLFNDCNTDYIRQIASLTVEL